MMRRIEKARDKASRLQSRLAADHLAYDVRSLARFEAPNRS